MSQRLRSVRDAAADLPVIDVVDAAVEALATSHRLVLEAPAGAGKTTVLPLALAEDARFDHGRIVVLEPRRVAARAAARRMSTLVGDRLGGHVGVTTRDDRRTSAATRVEVVTEGVLVRRLQRDPTLEGVSVVVLDEFHERSLEADLALAFSLDVAALRDDLSLVVMSATLDGARVARLLDDAPVVRSDGRLHPVDIVHLEHSMADRIEPAVAGAVLDALAEHDGDVLVFLPGVGEINRTAGELRGRVPDEVRLLPLHGGLPAAEQDAALAEPPAGVRHVVLATDLAESSLTVPGVCVVVDSGLAREPRFDANTGLSRLVTTRVSRDRADQRAGRAGRVRAGVAVRLWPSRDHAALPATRTPSVAQEDLAGFVLEAARWGVRDPAQLRTLDPPPAPAWEAGVSLLRSLLAVDQHGQVTAHGGRLADLPIDPRLGHMVISVADVERRLAVELAAILSDRDILTAGRGTSHVDLAARVAVLRGGRPPGGLGERGGGLAAVRRDVERLARLAKVGQDRARPSSTDVGRVLVRAFPDRVGKLRPEARGRFVLVSGRGARMSDHDQLAGEDLVVAADIDGAGTDAWIRRAAAIHAEDLIEALGHLVVQEDHVVWDRRARDVSATRRTRLGEVTLASGHLDQPASDATTAALLEGLRDVGLELLPWRDTERVLRARAAFLHEAIGDPWPAMDDETLLAELETWLAPYLTRVHRRAHLTRVHLTEPLQDWIGWDLVRRLDALAPTRLAIPSGRTAAVRYDPDAGPVVSAKLQEFFGAATSPTIADGRVPVTVELLSPANRPLAVTGDLAGFWAGAYHHVRAENRGRYAKHPWPEDPANATATGKTNRRLREG